jgi:zinc/manganese transport system permease protein
MAFVHVAGVLLVFTFLIVPAVCSGYLAKGIVGRFLTGWAVATLGSLASLVITARQDWPIGATIVCGLGLVLFLVIVASALREILAKKGAGECGKPKEEQRQTRS